MLWWVFSRVVLSRVQKGRKGAKLLGEATGAILRCEEPEYVILMLIAYVSSNNCRPHFQHSVWSDNEGDEHRMWLIVDNHVAHPWREFNTMVWP